jgi:signal transduction histidine kinase/DNA-binding response OmpR family regulator
MSHEEINKLINIYHNSHDVQSLCLTLVHDLRSDFILISWYITENLWYIPIIYDEYIDEKINTNKNNEQEGWYINEEPNETNIPITHTPINNYQIYKYDTHIILCDSVVNISNVYSFVCEAYIRSLAAKDLKRRYKYRQELLLSNICHSIRTPLNGILHMTNMLMVTDRTLDNQEHLSDDDDENVNSSRSNSITSINKYIPSSQITRLNKDHLNNLNRSTISLTNNIFDIIDMTQLDIGKLKITKDVFNIRELINQVIAITKTLTRQSNVRFEYHIEEIVPDYAYSDPKRIKQILINLIENAFYNTDEGEVILYVNASLVHLDQEDIDYMPITNTIIVDTDENNQYNLTFSVSDSGNGISVKMQSLIFKPPEVLCNTKQYGISLRVSYLLANILGGGLRIVYSVPDKGSTFEFNIIVYEEEPPIFDSNTLKILNSKRVLLVDDDNNKINLCKVMDHYGIIYTIASSYEEVLILHINKKYDLVICKTQLKTENGIKIAEQLRCSWTHTLFMALIDDPVKLPKGLFHEYITLPVEEFTFKNKLLTIFNTNYDSVEHDDTYILVVEDEPINRIIIEKLLRTKGYNKVDLVSNGIEALTMINNDINYYDMILIDIRMPIMSGFELAENISNIYKDKICPKILGVTAQMIMDDEPKEYLKDFIYKPIDIDELDTKIKQMMVKQTQSPFISIPILNTSLSSTTPILSDTAHVLIGSRQNNT